MCLLMELSCFVASLSFSITFECPETGDAAGQHTRYSSKRQASRLHDAFHTDENTSRGIYSELDCIALTTLHVYLKLHRSESER